MSVFKKIAEVLELIPAPVLQAASDPAVTALPTKPVQQQPSENSNSGKAIDLKFVLTAMTASEQWRNNRDQYVNHLMRCRDCHAPTKQYCVMGADLRQQYNETPMESIHDEIL